MNNRKISKRELLSMAEEARKNSYSPYSGITVGAALLAKSGRAYLGTNVENVAYSPSLCAERCAFGTAVCSGEREFSAIAILGGKRGEPPERLFSPCGVCRQVMAEMCDGDFEIILSEDDSFKLGELLPLGFDYGKTKNEDV